MSGKEYHQTINDTMELMEFAGYLSRLNGYITLTKQNAKNGDITVYYKFRD